jgi:hypothetical protein
MAGVRTPRTNKATSCCAVNATVMNNFRRDALKGSGSGSSFAAWAANNDSNSASGSQQAETGRTASTPGRVRFSAWAARSNPNFASESQQAETGRAAGLPWSDDDLMFELPCATLASSFFTYLGACSKHFPRDIFPWLQRNAVEPTPEEPPSRFVRPGKFLRWTPYLDDARAIFNDDLAAYANERRDWYEKFVRWMDRQGLVYRAYNVDYFARCYRDALHPTPRPRFSWPLRDHTCGFHFYDVCASGSQQSEASNPETWSVRTDRYVRGDSEHHQPPRGDGGQVVIPHQSASI